MLEMNQKRPLLLRITADIVFLAEAALFHKLSTQIKILGIEAATTNLKDLGYKSFVGLITGVAMIVIGNPIVYLGGSAFMVAFILNIVFGSIKCEDYVRPLPSFEKFINSGNSLYIEIPPNKKNMIVIPSETVDEEKIMPVYIEEEEILKECSTTKDPLGEITQSCFSKKNMYR